MYSQLLADPYTGVYIKIQSLEKGMSIKYKLLFGRLGNGVVFERVIGYIVVLNVSRSTESKR